MTKVFYRNIPALFYPEDSNILIGRNVFFHILLELTMWWDKIIMSDPDNHIKPDFGDDDPFNFATL